MSLWNLLPAAPWHYPFIPAILATICWVFLALLVIFVVIKDREGVLGCLTYAMILRLILLFWTPAPPPLGPPSDPVAEWRQRTSQAEQVLRDLKSDREMLQDQLHEADERHRRVLACEIDEIDAQIAQVERERSRLEGVVGGMESCQRRKERGKMVGGVMSDERREEAIRGGLEMGEGWRQAGSY